MGTQEGINICASFNINLRYFHYVSNEMDYTLNVKVTGKVHTITGHEGPEVE